MGDTLLILKEIRYLISQLASKDIITQEQHDAIYNRVGNNNLIQGTAQFIIDVIERS